MWCANTLEYYSAKLSLSLQEQGCRPSDLRGKGLERPLADGARPARPRSVLGLLGILPPFSGRGPEIPLLP